MKLIRASAKIISMTQDPLKLIERAGRVCYKSECRITDDSATEFVRMIIRRGHLSVLEHASATVHFIVDRGVSHEIVRHRLASYSQESTRYVAYDKDKHGGEITFIHPEPVIGEYDPPRAFGDWEQHMKQCEKVYMDLRDMGYPAQSARSVLPQSVKTELIMTANFREWRHFFDLRTSDAAHPQMREVARPLLKEFRNKVPIVFDDVGITDE